MTEFLQLKPGSNIIRIITMPFQYASHSYIVKGAPHHPHIKCWSFLGPDSCKLCIANERPYRRWMIGVLSYEHDEAITRIIDIDYKVFTQLRELSRTLGNPNLFRLDFVLDQNVTVVNLGDEKSDYLVNPTLKDELVNLTSPTNLSENELLYFSGRDLSGYEKIKGDDADLDFG